MTIKKFSDLKNNFRKLIIGYAVFLTLSSFAYIEIKNYIDSLENTKLSLKSTILTTRNKLMNVKINLSELEAAKKILQRPHDLANDRNDLQLDEAKAMIDFLKNKYNILNIETNISAPKTFEQEESNYQVISSDVAIKCSAMSDEEVFQFIDALIINFPSFKLIKSFKVVKQQKLSQNIMEEIEQGKAVALINAELVFEWQDFRNI